jgi:4-amino-4-deoxy-L-arabinose transferase-like glycosyltransferase
MATPSSIPTTRTTSASPPTDRVRQRPHLLILVGLWLIVFADALWSPPLLDDADATHSQAVQAMLTTGDYVTLHVNGIRYLEKPPLPYWIAVASLRLFTTPKTLDQHAAFAIHLPLALTVLALALLGYLWGRRAWDETTGFYTGLFLLTSTGVFLFTRVFIPDALLSLLLALALYLLLRALEEPRSTQPQRLRQSLFAHGIWATLACAVLTKGLVSLAFFFGTALLFLVLTGQLRRMRDLAPITGPLLLLAIAAPWHILAGLRNHGGYLGHGFFWFYFINEHVMRFLGRRIPRDYNKLPGLLYWTLHLVWLFPWSLFLPAAVYEALQLRREPRAAEHDRFRRHTTLLLVLFSVLVLVFFSISTNQEYYTFPVYLPLLMLLAAALTRAEAPTRIRLHQLMSYSYAALTVLGLAIAAALAYGLWSARHLPFVSDIGSLLAHRGVGDYTLSMSHFFDLTGPSFAALRLPATLALLAFAIGPAIAWSLHRRTRPRAAILAVALTSATFLVAAHIALVRFAPMLSSENFAAKIQSLEATHAINSNSVVLLYGDQAYGSSIPFYLGHHVLLVDGRSTSMWFGSTFPDAPPIFLTGAMLQSQWGTGARKLLFVPLEKRDDVDRLLGNHTILLLESSGKALLTDRPLQPARP